jgi:heat shock protein HslJ
MHRKVWGFVFLIVAMALAACGFGVASGQESIGTLDGEWALLALNGASLLSDTTINAAFVDGQVTGFSGCNSYFGAYMEGRSTIRFEGIGMTAMACLEPQGAMDQEQAYVQALQQVVKYSLVDAQLELLDAFGVALLVYERQEVFEGHPATLIGTEWQLLKLDGKPLDDTLRFTVAFAEQRYSGLAGCRHFEGDYQAGNGDIGFPSITMVEGTCPSADDGYWTLEGRFTDALGWARHWRIVDDRLEMRSARGEMLVFVPVTSMPEVSLDGTTWTLTTFIEGETATSLVAETEITLTFESGQVRGTAGCNSYGGPYALEHGALRIGEIAITEMFCILQEGVMEQETRYADSLRNVTIFEWDANQLTLRTVDGRGLVFTALIE